MSDTYRVFKRKPWDTNNAAFEDAPATELARILRRLAKDFEQFPGVNMATLHAQIERARNEANARIYRLARWLEPWDRPDHRTPAERRRYAAMLARRRYPANRTVQS